jgi:glycosyltransferase involved in cell wall biosynthesis
MHEDSFVTIGIPTRNAIEYLERFLNALYAISYPKRLQRIVFVDASDDETYQHIIQFKNNHYQEYESILVIKEEECPTFKSYPLALQRLSQARNICLENVIGEYFLSLDCDVIVESDVVTKLLSYFSKSAKIGAIGISYYRKNLSFLDRLALHQGKKGLRRVDATGFGCTMFRTDVLKLVGKFDESKWGIDVEIYQRIKKKGFETFLDFVTIYEHIKSAEGIDNAFVGLAKDSGRIYSEIKKNKPFNYVRQVIFFSIYLVAIAFAIISYVPLLVLTIIGFSFYFLRARGIFRLISPIYCFSIGILLTLSFYYHFLRDIFNLEEY